MAKDFSALLDELKGYDFSGMYNADFLHTWDKTTDELRALYAVAAALRNLRERNISPRIFDSGLAVSLFRDNSTRTRFSFSKATNLLGLQLQDLDEGKSQIAHGETVRETATMISFMADVIGIRDDMYIGKGDAYMAEVAESVDEAYKDGVLDHRPTLISLQSDSDHPTQSSADMLYLIEEFGGLENLRGKKVAVTWAYSPSYGKPLSCPQSLISLLPRFGMDVTLAHPEGYDAGIKALEKELLAQNATHMDWCSTRELMAKTAHGDDTIYMHPLPADISGVSCEHGEVMADVFDMHRVGMYKEASYKPYAIAAMIFLQKVKDPVATLAALEAAAKPRWNQA